MTLFSMIWLVIAAISPVQASSSEDLLKAIHKRDRKCIEIFLEQFDPRDIQTTDDLDELAFGVFKVGEEQPFVLRALSKPFKTAREAFVSELFFASSSKAVTSLTRVIDPSKRLRRLVLKGIKQSKDKATGHPLYPVSTGAVKEFGLSVMPFFSGERADDYLDRNFALEIRDLFVAIQQMPPRSLLKDFSISDLHRSWDLLEQNLKEQVFADLVTLIPQMQNELLGDAVDTFLRFQDDVDTIAFNQLSTIFVLDRLPSSVQTQVADLWALNYLVGIKDFHRENWLVHEEGHVIGFDFNRHSSAFRRGKVKFAHQNPFDVIDPSKILEAALQRKISIKLKRYLKQLDRDQLDQMAERAGYQLSDRKAKGLLKRARYLAVSR